MNLYYNKMSANITIKSNRRYVKCVEKHNSRTDIKIKKIYRNCICSSCLEPTNQVSIIQDLSICKSCIVKCLCGEICVKMIGKCDNCFDNYMVECFN